MEFLNNTLIQIINYCVFIKIKREPKKIPKSRIPFEIVFFFYDSSFLYYSKGDSFLGNKKKPFFCKKRPSSVRARKKNLITKLVIILV